MFSRRFILPPFMRNTLKLSVSTILMYCLPFVVMPILSRMYYPAAFGEWGVFSGMVGIVSVVLCLCYEQALIGEGEPRNVFPLGLLCLLSATVVCLFTYGIMYLGIYWGWSFFISFPCLALLIVYLSLHALNMVLLAFANWCEAYGQMSANNVVTGGSQALFRLLLGGGWPVVFQGNGLIFGTVMAQALSTGVLMWGVRDRLKWIKKSGSGWQGRMRELAYAYRKYPMYDAPSTLLTFAALNIPLLLLSVYYSKEEIGCYSVILQLLLLPMSFVGSAMGKVYFRDISKCEDEGKIKNITLYVMRVTAVLSILPVLFLTMGGDYVVTCFLGERWALAGRLALCLSIWAWPTILTQPLLPLYRRLSKQEVMLRFDGLYFGIGLLALSLGIYLCFPIEQVVLLYAFCVSLVKLGLFRNICKQVHVKYAEISRWYWLVSALVALCWMTRLVWLEYGEFVMA